MLSRLLEPLVMDLPPEATVQHAERHAEENRRFVADFLRLGPGLDPILDVATGTARIPIELCRQAPQAQVVAIDHAQSMLAQAQTAVAAASLTQRIRLQQADAKRLPFPARTFVAVVSNASMHHFPDARASLKEMLRVLKSGGWVFVRDLMRPVDEGQFEYLLATYAADASDQQRARFHASLRAAFTVDEIRNTVEELGLYADTVQATSDRHWTLAARIS